LQRIVSIFAEGRGTWQTQKKVAPGVFEGRLDHKARFFFI